MRRSISLYLFPAALCAAASPSPANVTISNAATQNMTCSGGVCAPTAADAVLNVQDLQAMLASGGATVKTTGAGVQAKDIEVKAPLNWSAATTLALDAYRAIDVNAKVSVAGVGGVSLTTNDGGGGGDFACNDKGRIEFSNLSSALAINRMPYTLVNSVAALATAVTNNPGGAFALARNYNAKKDGTFTSSPITTVFAGSFDGLGNAVGNLSINAPTEVGEVGFFAETNDATIANVRLVNETVQAVSGYVGGLDAIANGGAIAHSLTTGTISGGDDTGGLLGSSGAVIVGSGSAAAISGEGYVGGLIGLASGLGSMIRDSWASGNVSGNYIYIGGLVGLSQSNIKHSWASGKVSASGTGAAAGGLVGDQEMGNIERSYATGAVTCEYYCGGLLGWIDNGGESYKISESWATGNVTSSHTYGSAGGLLGYGEYSGTYEIVNSYATGAVAGDVVGGLVGSNEPSPPWSQSISGSYATGAVAGTGTGPSGGLIGYDFFNSHLKHTYWDMTTSGITNRSQGAGDPANDPGIKGLTDEELKSGLPKGFDPKIWKEDANINGGLPYLIYNPPAK